MTDEHTNGHEAAADPADGEPNAVQEKTAGAIASAVTAPLKLIPWRTTITKKLLGASLKQYHKLGGGHALGLIAEPGQRLQLRPIQYRAPKDCEDGERPGWVEKGGEKVWHAASDGRVVDYIGKVPIVALERDSHVEAGWLKPRIGQAIDLDNYQPLYNNPQIEAEIVADATGVDDAAIADGGVELSFDVRDFGNYAGAEIVNLDSGSGYDGMRVDFRKASEWAFEQTTTESMQMQEDRGYLMGQMSADNGPSVTKLLLICAAIILGVLGIVFVAPELLGGGGGGDGGGGGISPIMIDGLAGLV